MTKEEIGKERDDAQGETKVARSASLEETAIKEWQTHLAIKTHHTTEEGKERTRIEEEWWC